MIEALVAIATFALALTTVWLAFETRFTRQSEEKRQKRLACRASLNELLHDCKPLATINTSLGEPAILRLQGAPFDTTET